MIENSSQIIKIEPVKVQLIKVALGLGMSPEYIASALRHAGYQVSHKLSKIYLDYDQLEIIKAIYVRSVGTLFSRFKKNHHRFSKRSLVVHYQFFRHLVVQGDEPIQLYNSELDHTKVEAYFDSVVAVSRNFFIVRRPKKIVIRLKLKIVKTFTEIRRMIISTFIRYHFYNFSIDEESAESKFVCFS